METSQSSYHAATQRSSWLNEFLWICAGVDREVLRQCPSDHSKYAGIGGTILFTALMAVLSGGYAMSFVFGKPWAGALFGVFWGMLIFNLDRFIVNTMYSDGKVTISWQEFKSGLPRIIMALFLGIVISYPLELKIFDDEIAVKIEEMKADRQREYVEIDQSKLDSLNTVITDMKDKPSTPLTVPTTNKEIAELQDTISDKNIEVDALKKQIMNAESQMRHLRATNVQGHNNKRINEYIKQIRDLRMQSNKCYVEINKRLQKISGMSAEVRKNINNAESIKQKDIAVKQQEAAEIKERINGAKTKYNAILENNFHGLQAQMKAFNAMKEEDSSTRIASWLIMLLFVIIEVAPTFFRMMMEDGPYDDMVRAERHRVRVLATMRRSQINDEVNTEVDISVKKNARRLEAELAANEHVVAKVAEAQTALIERAVELWREVEMSKVEENPGEYIVTSDTMPEEIPTEGSGADLADSPSNEEQAEGQISAV